MKHLKQLLVLSVAVLLVLSCERAAAQFNFPNMDPQQMKEMQQQMQQRMLDQIRDQLAVTNDIEWNAIEPLIAKVQQGQMESMMGGIRLLVGNRGGGFPGFGEPDKDGDALQSFIDANPPPKQIREKLAAYREARKRKADELARNQAELRHVLNVRQEATLVLMGLLD
jgi:hypothetical protein